MAESGAELVYLVNLVEGVEPLEPHAHHLLLEIVLQRGNRRKEERHQVRERSCQCRQ